MLGYGQRENLLIVTEHNTFIQGYFDQDGLNLAVSLLELVDQQCYPKSGTLCSLT